MITIVDNGKGADKISQLMRSKNQIVKPGAVKAVDGVFILSDGPVTAEAQKAAAKILEKSGNPVMGIGAGMAYIAAFYGAKIKNVKAVQKQEQISLKKPSPLLLDFKRVFTAVTASGCTVEDLPENFTVNASSKSCEFEVIQDIEKPFFGVHFNPELGQDGIQIFRNFEKFLEIWNKYHRNG